MDDPQSLKTTLTENLTDQLPDITGSITDALAPFIMLSVVSVAVFIIIYITSMIRRWKVDKAILAMQKDIREMNERDKQREAARTPSAPPVPTPPDQRIIAQKPQLPEQEVSTDQTTT